LVYRVKLLPGVLQDAKSYYQYIAQDSPENALLWFNGLFEVIDSLENLPMRCPVAPETGLIGKEVRCLLYAQHYRILYGVEKNTVRIYHIRHTAQQTMTQEQFLRKPSQS
jgi:plasmid stabilization system protein ParE